MPLSFDSAKQRNLFYRSSLALSLLLLFGISASAQVELLNDECRFATPIPSADNYCSADNAFTNVGAAPDPSFTTGCITIGWENGVWFSFQPKESAVLIRVFGNGQGGTMRNPRIVLFENCSKAVTCTPGNGVGNAELVFDNLNIGSTYYIMVESARAGEGTFKLCIDDFTAPKSPEADCPKAVVLCDKSAFKVENLFGVGALSNELDKRSCLPDESQSSWYKWTCDVSGPLTFNIIPNNAISPNLVSDDIDFAVYELPAGLDDCVNKRIIKCMASGANSLNNSTAPLTQWSGCNGPTGLRAGDNDEAEFAGCSTGDNNYLSPLQMVAGRSYVLIINNYTRSGLGFAIDFGGTGTFLGPKPDFEINTDKKFECDKDITFTNTSESLTDPIVSYSWNFGDRATPNREANIGPHIIRYGSFGDKIAAITVETSRGCRVTKIKDFFIDACCKDTSTLDLKALPVDILCFGFQTGIINAEGIRGAGEYKFSLNDGPFQPNPRFGNLTAGDYTISVFDLKGCRDTLTPVVISEPPPITVDAGPDRTVVFGETTTLDGSYTSSNGLSSLRWTPAIDFPNDSILNPLVFPRGNTTYTLTVIDENGCTENDIVTLRIEKKYQVFVPNIFAPDENGNNDFFNIWTNGSVKGVELFEVYDRWGNLMYQGRDARLDQGTLIVGDATKGWDGRFQGRNVQPGVFAWRAKVRFIDDVIKEFAGDLTLFSTSER